MRKTFSILIMALICVICVFATDSEAQSVEIKSVYEYRTSEDYNIDESGIPVIFVSEFPVFSGAGTKNMAAAYANSYAEAKNAANVFTRKKSKYSTDDYVDELSKTENEYYLDITTCTIEYDKNGVVSIVQMSVWYMGWVYNIFFDCHTFDMNTGRELEITDVLQGTEASILSTLKREFEAENGELMNEPYAPVSFYLSDEGVVYTPPVGIIYGIQRGATLTIPYSRTDLVKAPYQTVAPTGD